MWQLIHDRVFFQMSMSAKKENTSAIIKPQYAETNRDLTPASVRKVISLISHCINVKVRPLLWGPVQTTPEKSEASIFILKRHLMYVFLSHCAGGICKRNNHCRFLDFCLTKTRVERPIVCQKLPLKSIDIFRPHSDNSKPAFSNSSGLKNQA